MTKHPILFALRETLKNNIVLTLALILAIIGSVGFAVLPPLALEKIVFELINNKNISASLAFLYFGLIALGGIFDALRGAFITSFGQKVTTALRSAMVKKLSMLPASYFNKNESGKILSRFTSDVETIDTLFKSGVIGMIVDLFKIIFILIAVFSKSMGLGVLFLAVTPIIFIISWKFKTKMKAAQLDNRRAIARINNHIPETLANARTIHTLKKQAYMQKRYRKYVNQSFKAFEKTYFYEAIYTPIINEASVIVIAVMMTLAALGGNFQSFFGMGVETAVAVIAYVNKIFSPIENLGMEIQNVQAALAGISRVEEFFQEKEKVSQSVGDISSLDLTKPAVEFLGASFFYDDKPIFENLSFSINKGESIAFVGRTGAGKTTIYRLILGLYSPNSGNVNIFGVSADQIDDKLKRKVFGYVEQSVKLIHGSVYDQIALNDDSISEIDVLQALETVGLKSVVNDFENGINTPCDEHLFSQGQLQLLAVARAIVYNPLILLLDEITANLDSKTEKTLALAIKNASSKCTVINISHRLGDIRQDTRIIDITKLKLH